MRKHCLLLCTASFILFSCRQEAVREKKAATSTPAASAELTGAELFEPSAVRQWLTAHPSDSARNSAAGALFMKGMDAYRNKKDHAAGKDLFRQSLSTYPTANAYYEFGNAAMDGHQFREALSAYRLAEAMGYSPLNRVLYNTACAYARLEQEDSALAYLEYAVEAGYNDAGNIMKDPDLAFARQSSGFHTRYASAISGGSNPEATMFQTYVREFPTLALPITLNDATRSMLNTDRYMSYEFERYASEMEGERFSRDVSKEFFYLTRIATTEEFTAVIYAIRNTISGENAPYAYVLASYSPQGKLLDKLIAGGQLELSDPVVTGTVTPDLHIALKEYRQVWEKDPEENGYYDNKVVSTSGGEQKNYHIAASGRIIRDGRQLGMLSP